MAEKNKLTPEIIEKICARKRADPSITKVALAAEFDLNRKTIDMALAQVPSSAPDATPSSLSMLAFESITRSPLNPRKTFDEAELAELAESIEIQEKVIGEQWRNWRDSEHDSDVQDLVIEDDDEPLSVNDIGSPEFCVETMKTEPQTGVWN